MNLIILGPPGSGKGTQSAFLVKTYQFTHFSTGDLFREEITKQTLLGSAVQGYLAQGNYVPDQLTNDVVAAKLDQQHQNLIFDGYPRTISQVLFLENYLKKYHEQIDLVIYLHIDQKTIITRLLNRQICPSCKRTYNQALLPPKVAGVCDFDQTKLVQRTDDLNREKIAVRLHEYEVATKPLISYWQQQKILFNINANEPAAQIHQQLATIIGAINDHN